MPPSLADGVVHVLYRELQREVRLVVARRHPRRERLDERASGSARGEDLEGLGPVESAPLDERDGLGQGCCLHAAEEVVHELEESAAAGGAEVDNGPAHHGQGRPGDLERLRGTADEEQQLARGRLRLAAPSGLQHTRRDQHLRDAIADGVHQPESELIGCGRGDDVEDAGLP